MHSIHCHRYRFTEIIIFAVNCKQEGCPDRPQSLHETNSSAVPVFLFSRVSPRQKSQYGDGAANFPFSPRREWSRSPGPAATAAGAGGPPGTESLIGPDVLAEGGATPGPLTETGINWKGSHVNMSLKEELYILLTGVCCSAIVFPNSSGRGAII